MKKKVFSLMMTLLLAFVGVAKADVVTIGDGTSTTYVTPFNSLWGYSFVEQVYTADEIGTAGTITAISFNLRETDAAQTNAVDVFMKNVSRSSFASVEDYEPVTATDMVFSGTVTFSPGWTTITLNTPFQYDGSSNLLIGMHEYTSGYSTRYFYYTSTPNAVVTFHSDGADPNPYDLSMYTGNKYTSANRANIQIDITPGGGGGGTFVSGNVTVHDGTTTNSYVPVYGFYVDAYNKDEMVYPAAELSEMANMDINSMKFYASNANVSWGSASFQVFLAEVGSTTLSDFAGPGTIVYEGALSIVNNEMEVNFTTPYHYNGGNLLVGVYNPTTGSYSSCSWYGESVTGASIHGYSYSGLSSVTATQRNFLPKTTFSYSGMTGGGGMGDQLHVKYMDGENEIIDSLNLGVRPVGAWMEPFNFTMYTDGPTYTVTVLDFTPSDGLFSVEGEELPFQVIRDNDVELGMSTNATYAGVIERQFVAITEGNRAAHIWPLVVEMYDPAIPDVWEKAYNFGTVANNFTYRGVPSQITPTVLHNDYTLPFPEIPEGNDAVYKLTFNNDVILNAEVSIGDNGKVALYREGFEGEGGPMATNNYVGPSVGGGAAAAPFEAQIGEGTSTLTYFPFHTLWNYSLGENLFLASELNEAGVTSAPMTSLSWYVASTSCTTPQNNISIWMANVSDEALTSTSHITSGMTLVYTGNNILPATGWNEFVFNEGSFAWDGHSNVLIVCQRLNGSWQGSVSWQTHNPGFVATCYDYDDYEVYNCQTTSYSMYTSSTSRANIIMKGGNRDRATVPVTFDLTDSYGDGWNGAALNVVANDGTNQSLTISSGSTASYTLDINEGAHVNLTWTSGSWDGECSFVVSMNGETVLSGTPSSLPFEFDIPGAAPAPLPLDYSYGPVITDMPVEAGTYYLVASSTDADFEVTINADAMPCPEVEGFAFNPTPADDADGIEPGSVTLRWNIPTYATGWRLIFGTTYHPEAGHPQTIIYPEDGSFSTTLANSYTVRNLWNNTNYFWRVEFNNAGACPDGVSSPVWGFTTHLNIPQNLTAVDYTVFDDETIVLNWNAVVDRTYRQYNVYRDGEYIGHTTVNNIGNTTYTDGPLAYNMGGYVYYVTAVYDEGESAPSDPVTVKVSGYGNVDGHVYEQDGTTGIAGATVTMVGQDEFGVNHTYNFNTNNQGYYSGHIYAGSYNGSAAKDGYQTIDAPVQGNPIAINYNQTTSPIDYMLDENFDPVCTVIAQYYPDSLDPQAPYVKVYWGCGLPGEEIIEPFETGDFSLFDWQLDPTYPWVITTENPYEGMYCMKSGNQQVLSSTSTMQVTVNIPADGEMSFFGKISCEQSWDYGYFYIDGQQMGSYTGQSNWAERKFPVTAGDHTFKWEYTEDFIISQGDDCFYVDYITFYRQPEPAQPGWVYYDDGVNVDAIGLTAGGSFYWGVMFPPTMLAGNTLSKVSMYDYAAHTGTIMVYQGGTSAPGNLVYTQAYSCTGSEDFVEWTLNSPVTIDPTQQLWIVMNNNGGQYVASCCANTGDANGRWISLDGVAWEDVASYGLDYTWMIRAYVANGAKGEYVAPAGFVANTTSGSTPIKRVKGETIPSPFAVSGNAETHNVGVPAGSNRAFSHYRVYRTNCYNDGPYTTENTIVLACELHDTIYIDVSWPDAAPGVYKWGVGCVYVGNRGEEIEGPIHWAEPMAINNAVAEVSPEEYARMNGYAPRTEQTVVEPMPVIAGMTRGNHAYACNAYGGSNPTGWITYDIDAPGAGTSLNSGLSVFGGDLAADGYVYATYNDNTWKKIDPLTGSVVGQGNLGMFFVDCAYDYTTNTMYGSYSGGLYTWDLATNTTTLVGSMGSVQSMQMIAIDLDGQMYGIEYSTGNFDRIDKTTGAITVVGSTGYSPAYVQGGGFDHNTGKLYWAGYTSTGIFCEIDKNTGAATLLGNNVGEQLSWCVPYTYNPGPTPPSPGANPIQEPRESEIVWSNCLDKDMYLDHVSVNVLLNSADSPEGTTVNFVNLNEYEQQTYPVAEITLDESGYYLWDNFRKGEYAVKIEHIGYEPIADTVSIWETTDLRYVMIEIIYGVENIYVSRTGWAMWDPLDPQAGGSGINPGGGGGQGGSGDTFSYDFEDSSLSGLVLIDGGSPQGYGWQLISTKIGTGYGHNASVDGILSQSYDNNYGVIYPDNYVIFPQSAIANGSTFSFWACAQDASYAAEHFGVAISTTGTNASDFTMLNEWTMTSKGERHDGERGLRQGSWHNYSVDLSAYAGQQAYIAIRHFNCSDMFYLDVDDVELTNGAKSGNERHLEYYKVMCTSIDGVPIFNHNTVHPFCQLSTNEPYNAPLVEGEHYLCKVAVMYSTGMSAWSEPVEWVYEPCDHWGPVDYVDVSTIGEGNLIEWGFDHGFNPYGGGVTPGPGGPGDAFTYDFENSSLSGLVLIDGGSPQGYGWQLISTKIGTGYGHNASVDGILSQSYDNNYGVVYPDNYVIFPQSTIGSGATFSFWACAQDGSYAAEHFGVAISTTGTNASDFTMLNEWTMTAKGERHDGPRGLRQGNWYNYSVDLSAYAGQQAYLAIRHFNCSDMFYLDVDDVELTAGAKASYSALESGMLSNGTYAVNITDIDNFDARVFFLYNLSKDVRFDVINGEAAGMFIVSVAEGYEDIDLEEAVKEFTFDNANQFNMMDKVQAANVARTYKAELPMSFTNSLMMDIYAKSRENNLCELGEPFCTDLGMYEFPAGVNAGSGEPGPDYDCLYTTPNPAWYYMKMADPGDIDIYMYSTPSVDIDFCCWGPFADPISPCPNGLTSDKVVSCSYSAQPTEHCMIPASAQTGEYYILVITNYSNQACNINFSKVAGSGTTDCNIVVNTDIIGFLITQDGEYLAFAGPDDREYTDLGEYGAHEYCVRPIYPGEMTLPDHNYGWSMGCPVCQGGDVCAPGAPIYAEELTATDQIKVYWGDQNPGPGPGGCEGDEFTVNFESGMPAGWTTIDGGTPSGYGWHLASTTMGTGYGHNGSSDCVVSQSYDNNYGIIYPDNYLISPAVTLCEGSVVSFWACAQDASYAAEHFGVAISTTGTNAGDFTMLQEWTMTAKGERHDGERGLRQGNWYQYTVNLGDYAGEARYIAIRHFNCSDMFYLDVDDIELTSGAKAMRDGLVKYNVYRSTDNANYTLIGEVPYVAGQTYYEYIDTPASAGTYYYQVTAFYGDCESQPAVSGMYPDQNYVVAGVDAIDENSDNIALFPNPTNGNVTIQATGMNRIVVVSVLGQVVYDTELDADEFTLNMAQFNAGMYMVRVYTENGMAVKRVTVMR